MIFFVPGYDEATRANLAVARLFPDSGGLTLLADGATREALLGALNDGQHPLFTMTHGKPGHIHGQDGDVVLSVDSEELSLLRARAVYAFACHTATRLGAVAARAGAVWWGYTGAIQCPDDAQGLLSLDLFVQVFDYIRRSFPEARTAEERARVLRCIADLCEQAQSVVDERALAEPDLDVTAAYYCLLHIWDRLRIWAPDEDAPQQHPRAQPPSLFLST